MGREKEMGIEKRKVQFLAAKFLYHNNYHDICLLRTSLKKKTRPKTKKKPNKKTQLKPPQPKS